MLPRTHVDATRASWAKQPYLDATEEALCRAVGHILKQHVIAALTAHLWKLMEPFSTST